MEANLHEAKRQGMFCSFDINQQGQANFKEARRLVDRDGHKGIIYEMGMSEGISLGYYKIQSTQKGKVVIDNTRPFVQISYTLYGHKTYEIEGEKKMLASIKKLEYNYLFLTNQKIQLSWLPSDQLEFFELGISPEQLLRCLPAEHPIYQSFNESLEKNIAAPISKKNLSVSAKNSNILYDMLNCPLDGRYKQLYMRGKTAELLAIQLEEYEQQAGLGKYSKQARKLKQEDIDRMYFVREIILANIHSPCSLIDLAHQVGTNDAYLKRHFKEVFGTTVFGYLHVIKMEEARRHLLDGQSVSEVSFLTGYKYVSHFTRAFKKHFGISPNQVRR